MGAELCHYQDKPRTVPLRPWHDAPKTPCGCGQIGCLEPYNPSGWYGPADATLFCPACGTGWHGTDAEIVQALISQTWWDAFERGQWDEHDFSVREGGC